MIQRTSIDSFYEEKRKGLSDRHKEIVHAFMTAGPMTDRELQHYLGKHDANEVRPRRFELASVEYGMKLEPCPTKRPCKVTGKTAIVWRLRTTPLRQLEMFGSAA